MVKLAKTLSNVFALSLVRYCAEVEYNNAKGCGTCGVLRASFGTRGSFALQLHAACTSLALSSVLREEAPYSSRHLAGDRTFVLADDRVLIHVLLHVTTTTAHTHTHTHEYTHTPPATTTTAGGTTGRCPIARSRT